METRLRWGRACPRDPLTYFGNMEALDTSLLLPLPLLLPRTGTLLLYLPVLVTMSIGLDLTVDFPRGEHLNIGARGGREDALDSAQLRQVPQAQALNPPTLRSTPYQT